MRVQLTVRVLPEIVEYVTRQALAADLSVNEVTAALLERAVTEGWQVEPRTRPQTSRPGTPAPPGTGPGPIPTSPGGKS